MLTLDQIHKQFPSHDAGRRSTKVLDGLSLDVRGGEIFTLLGPSGCGKTTLLRVIAGLERPDAGRVIFHGETWNGVEGGVFVPPGKRGIGLVFQSYAVWPHLDVFGNVAYPLRHRGLDHAEICRRVRRILARVGLEGFEHRASHHLSGGQQQRVAMARALVAEPRLLLLDEPFSNLDVGLRQRLRLELRELQRVLGLTVILVTHDQEDAFALSDRIAVLQAGRVVQIGTAEQLHDAPASPFVFDFIGKGSRLSAIAGEAGQGTLGGGLVDLNIAVEQSVGMGTPLTLRVRPADISLSDDGDGVAGVVGYATFVGDRYETYVQLDDGQELIVYQPRDRFFEVGRRVRVSFLTPPLAVPEGR